MKLKATNKATMLLRARRRRALNFGAFAVSVWREPSPLSRNCACKSFVFMPRSSLLLLGRTASVAGRLGLLLG